MVVFDNSYLLGYVYIYAYADVVGHASGEFEYQSQMNSLCDASW